MPVCPHCRASISEGELVCPHCGSHDNQSSRQQGSRLEKDAAKNEDETEKDRRGVALPARHRVGGIITPQ